LKRALALVFCMLCPLVAPALAAAQSTTASTGGAEYGASDLSPLPRPVVPGAAAVLQPDGFAAAPADAPPQVQEAIWAANELQDKPYRYGGGHASFIDRGYDCSGTVSFALNAAGLLKRPRDSSGFMRYGARGPGQWITIYTHPGHAYVVIAGLRLDTSSAGAGGGKGPRWRATGRPTAGFTVRHPVAF
jgi:hypothetical protein